jgi:hypothetical protein
MRGITSASAISTNENFTLAVEAIDYQARNFFDFRKSQRDPRNQGGPSVAGVTGPSLENLTLANKKYV